MRFDFVADQHTKVKTFLKAQGVSKGLLAKIKYTGGEYFRSMVVKQNATYLLEIGDSVTINITCGRRCHWKFETDFFSFGDCL